MTETETCYYCETTRDVAADNKPWKIDSFDHLMCPTCEKILGS